MASNTISLTTMSKKEKRYFEIARAVALSSEHQRVQIGAVLIDKKQIVSAASNSNKTHPQQKRLNILRYAPNDRATNSIHAEMAALLKAERTDERAGKDDLHNADLFVYREDRNGNIRMCRPCKACMAKIKQMGIRSIYYTTNDGFCKENLI